MTDQNTSDKPKFNHYSITAHAIFKGFTKNDKGTFFASLAIPTGQFNNKQTFINVSAVVTNSPAMQLLASTVCDLPINEGRGTSADVTLTDMTASNSFDSNSQICLDKNNVAFINYSAFLNNIAFK